MHVGAHKGQKKVSDHLEMKLQVVVSHPTQELGIASGPVEEPQVL